MPSGEILIGAAETDITPPLPVALSGQFRTRIATTVETPLVASLIALEKRDDGIPTDQAVIVSCDLLAIPDAVTEKIRTALADRKLPGLEPDKVFLNATHTHTAPVMINGRYRIPENGVTQPDAYVAFLVTRIVDAIEEAWSQRAAGSIGWGLGHAVVGHNRRAVYADGSAVMYGKTARPDFTGIEGTEDHGVECLFFWDHGNQLVAAAVNVACTAQEVENRSAVNADYWHEVRTALRRIHGDNLIISGWIGAAGDQSPHLMFRNRAEERMRETRGLTRLQEIARRITHAFEEACEGARTDRHPDPVLRHEVVKAALPGRKVTDSEAAEARETIRELTQKERETGEDVTMRIGWVRQTLERYAGQAGSPIHPVELHLLRLGEVAICSNPFELYTEYGTRMKAQSPAQQTFVIQLAGAGSYLATRKAETGGGYSDLVNSCLVGPEGGDRLVDETVSGLASLW